MHLEEFSEGSSFLHKADPRVKIVVFTLFSVLCAVSSGIKSPLIYFFYSLALLFVGRLRLKALISRVAAANFFIVFIWIFIPLSYGKEPYITFGSIKLSYEGINYALSITIKCNAIILATITLLGTSPLFSLAHAMLHLKIPEKLVTIFFLFYRYITLMHEEYLKIKNAITLRGFVPKTNLHTYKTYAYILGGMVVKSYERAEDIYKAMLCRGFKGNFPLYEHFHVKRTDVIFGILSLAIFILCWVKC